MKIYPFDIIEATFNPTNTTDLKENAEKWIGWRGKWQVLWEIDEGNYTGQYAIGLYNQVRAPFIWVPQEDLMDIVLLDSLEKTE